MSKASGSLSRNFSEQLKCSVLRLVFHWGIRPKPTGYKHAGNIRECSADLSCRFAGPGTCFVGRSAADIGNPRQRLHAEPLPAKVHQCAIFETLGTNGSGLMFHSGLSYPLCTCDTSPSFMVIKITRCDALHGHCKPFTSPK